MTTEPRKFKVTFEATAAVYIDVTVEAADEEEARKKATRHVVFNEAVYNLMTPSPEAIRGYAEETGHNITRIGVEVDEMGFDEIEIEKQEN